MLDPAQDDNLNICFLETYLEDRYEEDPLTTVVHASDVWAEALRLMRSVGEVK